MRDRDRLWWLMLIIGLVFGIGTVPVLYFGVGAIPTPTDNPFMTSADYWQIVGVIGFCALICLVGGVTFLVMASRARRRHLTRLAALQGDTQALPLAEIHPDPTQVPDVAQQPLQLQWRIGTATRVFRVPLLGIQALLALASVGLSIFQFVAPFFPPFQPSQPMSLTEIVLRVAGTLVAIGLGSILCVLGARVLPFLLGRPFGVSATTSGIDAQTELGTHIHMAWEEMRLLEVATAGNMSKRSFSLYAPGKRIDWTEYTSGLGAEYVPVGATAIEMTLRQAALLSLIAARTRLAPRTLVKTFESKPSPARQPKRSSNAAALLVFALIMAGITAADFLFPVTPFTWVNWLSAGSLALVTLSLIVASVRTALARSTLPLHATPPSVGAPSLEAPEVAYLLTWKTPLLRRLLTTALGLCLAVNVVPGAWVLLQQLALALPGYHPQLLSDDPFTFMGRYMLAFVLGAFGIAGLGVAYAGTMGATSHIRADKDGLTTAFARRERLMPWSSVQDISWGAGRRGRFAYLVKSDVPTFLISWFADPQTADTTPPSDGAMPIGPDELAALVAAHTGKPIRVREDA